MRPGVAAVLCLVAACVRSPPPPEPPTPPAPTPLDIPAGCEASLAGPWIHATDPSYLYDAEDDGGTVTLRVTRHAVVDAGFQPRRFRRDAGPAEPPDAGDQNAPLVQVVLERTPGGFVGSTIAALPHPSGRSCEAKFRTRILSCEDAGLLLETETATALGDTCQAPASPLDVPRLQHALRRTP